MRVITRAERIYFGAVGLLALWVGTWGYFIPAHVDKAIPWLVPPLHSHFLGSMYLSGATFMIGGILSHYYAEVRVMVRAIAIWTGMLFVVSLFYLGEFDYSRTQVWIWFGAYLIYPLIALWLMWKDHTPHDRLAGSALPAWVRGYSSAQGVLVTILALFLLLAYGLSSLMSSRLQTWAEIRVVVTATFVFAFGVLLASFLHGELFSPRALSTWLWFGGFVLATSMLGLLTLRATREKRGTA
jgi:hypothetical protein